MASGTLFEPAAAALTQLMGSAEFENERTRHNALCGFSGIHGSFIKFPGNRKISPA